MGLSRQIDCTDTSDLTYTAKRKYTKNEEKTKHKITNGLTEEKNCKNTETED